MLPEPNPNSGNTTSMPPEGGPALERSNEQAVERVATPVQAAPVAVVQDQTVVQPAPVQAVPVAHAPSTDPGQSSSPLIADDVDVIEKEWVDKAKKIVNATKNDPHVQEKEVSKLQADYLMKRYNKKLKVSE